MSDVVAWVALHALDGWLLAGVWLLWSALMVAAGRGWQARTDDRRRAAVRKQMEERVAANINRFVPPQRGGRD